MVMMMMMMMMMIKMKVSGGGDDEHGGGGGDDGGDDADHLCKTWSLRTLETTLETTACWNLRDRKTPEAILPKTIAATWYW